MTSGRSGGRGNTGIWLRKELEWPVFCVTADTGAMDVMTRGGLWTVESGKCTYQLEKLRLSGQRARTSGVWNQRKGFLGVCGGWSMASCTTKA